MESVIDFFNYILDLLDNLPNDSDTYWERIVMWLMISYLEVKLMMLEFAFSIAQTILSALNISQILDVAWSSIDSQILGVFTYLKIPEAINMILSAFLTRFVLGLLP